MSSGRFNPLGNHNLFFFASAFGQIAGYEHARCSLDIFKGVV